MSDQSPFASRWLLGPGPDRVKFYTRLYTLPAPASPHALIVFVHGYDEHIGRHERVHTRVAERGVAVFAWDQRGFGRTALGNLEQDEGTESGSGAYGRTGDSNTVMRDVRWAIDTARRFVPADTPVFLWGHSMGGGIVLDYAILSRETGPGPLAGVLAVAPLLELGSAVRPPAPVAFLVGLAGWLLPNTHLETPVLYEEFTHEEGFAERTRKDPLAKEEGTLGVLADIMRRGKRLLHNDYKLWPRPLPIVILHGTSDKINSYVASKTFSELLDAADKELITYEGMRHALQEEPDIKEKFIEDIIAWIEAHASRQ